uniref:receptor protein-tyrosine kinase n=1 Tax=Ciona savignyi TaxID=51511 RepID=H2YUP7_CIOSA
CFGTSSGLSVGEDRVDHYSKMAQRYRGCKIVKGNLEITALENPEIDTSIFKDIEEVTGYVIISLNFVPYLPLEKLRIIRGRELFREKYALVISLNNNGQDENQGLKELRLKSLTEIVSGGVIVRRNHQLCFTDTINWSDILHKATREAYDIEVEPPPTTCEGCDASCNGSCWGQGPTMCQRRKLPPFSHRPYCASKCGNSRCKGPEREDCCAPECASGCTGPSDRDCITCLHVNNSGSCEYACPSAHMYDPQTERNIRNPFFKYHYNDHCVDECPSNLLVEENGCVKSCRKQFHDDGTGVCVPCTEELCSGNKGGPLASIKTINSTNIHLFEGCNTVVGNVVFQSYVFAGDNHTGLAPINISQLEVFRTVKTITGYLKIMSWPRNLTDFSIFENLETITGIRLYKDLAAIIQSLGFRSLKSIRHGNVYIGYLTNLCYDRTINWTLIIEGPKVYRGFVNGLLLRKNKKTCGNVSELCHAECNGCWGPGADSCHECLHFSFNGTCLPKCHKEMGIATAVGETECLSCDSECEGTCHGAGPRNCTKCRRYNNNGTCTSLCPRTKCKGPGSTLGIDGCHRCHVGLTTRGFDTTECIPRGSDCPEVAIAIAVPLVVVTCIFILILFFGCRHRRKVLKRKQQRSIWKLARLMEPMTPSGVAPNQAQLRIVKEAELRIGKILGSGAFGTVHKGYWIPDLAPRERVKVPVAIKVLRDESSQVASNEILDEAFVMASCEHPNLVRLLGISLSQRIMLITQLMPLGNLLEYVRDNKDNIGSQHMLNWSLQIAKGMRYLSEEKHLVHRDLAARNVLVKSPNHVRITDFGLAKLLDVKEDVYRAEGGKMPIKWLALESIQHRIFTQKSDVWSFGITMWELMTFGKKPYENVPAREVHTLLERGERLPQPYVCTIDIYMLLIKCWTVDAEARPTFRELSEELSKMARDPQRYVVIDNDGLLNDLPSPITLEFLRSLMHDEGDDFPITDAEEYLHPQ